MRRAMLDAGFAEYLTSRPKGTPLFDVAADADGNGANNAGATRNRFLTTISSPRGDVSDYLSGSANSLESRKYGTKGKHKGFPLLTLIEAIDKVPSTVAQWRLD